jgi:hypothetical protein
MSASDDRTRIDAVLRHLGCGQDLRDFPGTGSEKLALIRTAASRGLIAWQRGRGRYELTSIGWSELAPRRRFTLASMLVSTAMGAAVGAAALAILWLPADASHRSAGRHAAASVARPADAGVHAPAPAPQTASTAPAVPAEPAKAAEQPVPVEPIAEVAPTQPAAVKKSRHKTASRRRREETVRTWADADPWRGRSEYSGYGGQGGSAFR